MSKVEPLTTKITCETNNGVITAKHKLDSAAANTYKTVMDTKERMVRDALIGLGWLPPDVAPRDFWSIVKLAFARRRIR